MLRRTACVIVAATLLALARSASRGESVPDIFPSIPEVRSSGGVASLELDVVLDPANGSPTFEYAGIVGLTPTIRVRPGDSIAMTVHNAMPAQPSQPDDVNVHFHGLTVSPEAPGDDVLTTIAHPGGTLHYRVKIPADHEPGLYWYHPHAHGTTYAQVTNGMSGAIVVEGLQQHLPALRGMRERILVLRDVPIGPSAMNEDMPMSGMAGMTSPGRLQNVAAPRKATNAANPCRAETALAPTLNRQLHAHIGIRPGERQLFRVVNASASRYFDLSVDGGTLGLVARDGIPLDAFPGTPPLLELRHILLPPAARAEFIVTGQAHSTELRSACFNSGATGDADPAVDLATLVDPLATTGAPAPALASLRPITALRIGRALPNNVLSVPVPPAAAHRTLRFTEDSNGFYINGKAYARGEPPSIVARSGTVEEWTILNETDEVHDFHIHQVHFFAESINGEQVVPRIWRDTLNVPPRTKTVHGHYVPGKATIVVDFRDPIVRGTFVYHCHILDHEDQGMMAVIKVIE